MINLLPAVVIIAGIILYNIAWHVKHHKKATPAKAG